jgi:hypothetical protein
MMFRRFRTDERGSLPLAMLVITIGLLSSALLTPIVVRQFTETRSLIARNTELNGAQAGLDTMMAEVRAASEGSTATTGRTGLLSDLPGAVGVLSDDPTACGVLGNAGTADTSTDLPFEIKIVYFDADGGPLGCPPSTAPSTAFVTSAGIGADGRKRILTATYVFSTSNTIISGGSIRIDTASPSQLCFDAGSTKSPSTGTSVTMQVCNGGSRQLFGYTADLFLKLINSERAPDAPDGMCLIAGNPPATTHANKQPLTFQPCPVSSNMTLYPTAPLFQWSLDGTSRFVATTATQNIDSSYCINMTANLVGSNVFLNPCSSTATTTIWRSSTGVGAGMASDSTNQLVNYAQFSRCLDVTGQTYSATNPYMIAWFCKQAPNKKIDANQQWFHPAPKSVRPTDGSDEALCGNTSTICAKGNIIISQNTTVTNGVAALGTPVYCLKSPLSATSGYATVVPCPNGSTNPSIKAPDTGSGLLWTVYHDTGSYATSWRILDTAGLCLTPTDQNAVPKDAHGDGTSKIKVAVCSSNDLQKWNAPANTNIPTPLTNLNELPSK